MKNNEKESQGSSQGLIEELFEEYVGSSKFLISLGVLLLGMGSCSYLYMAGRASLQESTPQLQRENIFGDSAPEEFYQINGKRCYLKIDDKAIEVGK